MGPNPQNPLAKKQHHMLVPVLQNEVPPRPPLAHKQPLDVVLVQHTVLGSPQPEKHKSCAYLGKPTQPHTKLAVVTAMDFLEYPPALPGSPEPQQHIREPDPPAPHISTMAQPAAGGFQHNPLQ